MKMNLDDVRFAVDAVQMLDSVTSSVNGLYPIEGVEFLIAAEVNFSSATVLRIADLEGQQVGMFRQVKAPPAHVEEQKLNGCK